MRRIRPFPSPFAKKGLHVAQRGLDALPPGTALDAACGTGRHARYLHARGHRVIGVDASPAMLEVAREALPDADLRLGNLTALPLETASVDLAVCSLAAAAPSSSTRTAGRATCAATRTRTTSRRSPPPASPCGVASSHGWTRRRWRWPRAV